MRWYGDNSELNGIWNAEIPDILIFGGILISEEEIPKLMAVIESQKKEYSPQGDFPIKYNMRDLQAWFDKDGRKDLYTSLLSNSNTWRRSIIQDSLSVDYSIIVSCLNFYSSERKEIIKNKENVTRYTFANALMRVALCIKERKAASCEVFLDWPDAGKYTPFIQEYRSALYKGLSYDTPNIRYYTGPLKSLGFSDSPYFTKMEECVLLQFSDLLIGAVREFVDFCLDQKPHDSFGVQLVRTLVPKFRGYPGRIVGHGIIVSPRNSELRNCIFRRLFELRNG